MRNLRDLRRRAAYAVARALVTGSVPGVSGGRMSRVASSEAIVRSGEEQGLSIGLDVGRYRLAGTCGLWRSVSRFLASVRHVQANDLLNRL